MVYCAKIGGELEISLMIGKMLKTQRGISATVFLSSMILRLLLLSVRWQYFNRSKSDLPFDRPVIFINWHSRLLAMPKVLSKHSRTSYIISPSYDGQLIAGTVAPLGISTIWGSRSKKAISGYRAMMRHLKSGGHIGITPDGPRGPARQAAMGALMLAKSSGAPLVPITWSAQGLWRLSSWDRLAIPKPFSRGVQIFGAPIYVPHDADAMTLDGLRLQIEDALNALGGEADLLFGHSPDDEISRYGTAKVKRK